MWIWKMIVIRVLYLLCELSYRTIRLPFLMVLVLYHNMSIIRFMFYEGMFLVFVWWVMIRSGYERGFAVMYLRMYSFCVRFILIAEFEIVIATFLIILIGFSKLPVFRLHIWLPKVHVEATIIRSIILAGVVLKAGTVFCCWYCTEIIVLIMGMILARFIIITADRKVIIAYSSVAHITLCVVWLRIIAIYGRWSHVIVSPLIFVAVYVAYLKNGSRLLRTSFKSTLLRMLLLFNVRFPIIRGFYSEVLVMSCSILILFCRGYYMMRMVSMNLFKKMKRSEVYVFSGFTWMVIVIY